MGFTIGATENGCRRNLLTAGMEAFHDYEVLELLLTYAIRQTGR